MKWTYGGWLLPVAMVAGLTVLGQRQAVPELRLASAPCDPVPAFHVTYDPYDAVRRSGTGWTWQAQGLIELRPCGAGTLTLRGSGVRAGGEWPVLIVGLDGAELGHWTVDRPRTLTVPIPHGGTVTVGFMNAYYNASVRPIQRRELHVQVVQFAAR